MQGVIKKLLAEKGYGFIRGDDGVERFFHRQDCRSAFEGFYEGLTVTFEDDRSSPKGPRATGVQSAE